MIRVGTGNLLAANTEALVNTVNTEGVMGKGIALQFKKAYPRMYEDYRRAARAGEIRLGTVQVWSTDQLEGPNYIINFPTKGHWKSPSRLRDIEVGLVDLVRVVRELGIRSIAVPPLGCGNGGLFWDDVRPVIESAFESLPDIEVMLFAPAGAPAAADMPVGTERPVMTRGRAALVQILHRYTLQSLMAPGLIESQKLMYFLQEAGEPLRLKFGSNRYGPYADNLRHVLKVVEGHFVTGFGDGSAAVAQAEAVKVLPGAFEEAESVLADADETQARIDRVLELASGFDSAYGLELLATVHWLATHEHVQDDQDLVEQVRGWSPRKERMFTPAHIAVALEALRSRKWIPEVPASGQGRKRGALSSP